MITKVFVLRLFHRRERDKRITTHCALVARAFLSKKMFYCGDRDEEFETKVKNVVERFGGDFKIEYVDDWKSLIKNFDGLRVHLTMYGIPLIEKIEEIRKHEKILVIIGSEKVPKAVYELVDYNVSITLQPHSEVAALAVFLDRLLEGKAFYATFDGAKIEIIPSEKGKRVIKKD